MMLQYVDFFSLFKAFLENETAPCALPRKAPGSWKYGGWK